MDNVVGAPSFYINPHGIMPFICGIFLLLLGFFVSSKNIKSKRNISWLFLSLTTALWTLSYSLAYFLNKETSLIIVLFKIGYTGIIFIPIAWLQFIIYFLDLKKQKKIIPFLHIIGFIFVFLLWGTNYFMSGLYKYYWGFYPKSNFYVHPAFLAFYSIQWTYGIFLLFQKIIKEKSPLMKNRTKYVILSLVAVFPGLGDFLGNYGVEFYPLGGAALVTICLIILTYSIYKYRLMDIRIALTRAGIFIFIYTFVLGFPLWFGIKTGLWIWTVLLMGILSTVGPFIYSYLRQQIENVMLKEQQRYQQSIRELAKRMTQIRELDKLFVEVVAEVYSVVQPQFIALYTFSSSEKSYVLSRHHLPKDYAFDKQISLNSQLIVMLSKNKRPMLAESAGFSNLPLETLVVPYFTEGSLFAFLVLGQKSTKMMYSDSDFIVFDILSSQVSLAIENCLFWQEEKTRLAKEEQIRRQRAMDHFSASLAHEIDNPVFAVSGIAEVVKMEITEDLKNNIPQDKLNYLSDRLNRITSDLSRISKMIKAVREFSSQTKGEQTEMKFEEVLEGFSSIVEPQLKYEGIFFEKEIEPNIYLKANKIHLEEVLVNLATNAIHAVKHNNRKEKKITLRVHKNSPKTFLVEFKDNGYGIKPELLEDIFLDFVTTKASTEGTGIGLGRVRKIVENHGGKIWAQSQGEGKGAMFLIELPLVK